MGEWKRPDGQRKRESDRWGPSANKSWSHGKPPRIPSENADVRPVPGWEKKFCFVNGICWGKVVETKQFLHQYSNITGWDDSAGKEAFDNAKARYWAQINGYPLNPPLPDPDLFIDSIDHDAPPSHLKLYENLCGSLSDDEGDCNAGDCNTDEWGVGGVILWDSHYAKEEEEVTGWVDVPTGWGENRPIVPTGWGDVPVQPTVEPNSCRVILTSWGDNSVNPTGWVDHGIIPTGWGDVEEGLPGPWNNNEAGQYWKHNGNYWNNNDSNGRNSSKYNQNSRFAHGAGRFGSNKNRNRSCNKGKQWRRKDDFSKNANCDNSRRFCAPLNQPTQNNDSWIVPRTVS